MVYHDLSLTLNDAEWDKLMEVCEKLNTDNYSTVASALLVQQLNQSVDNARAAAQDALGVKPL